MRLFSSSLFCFLLIEHAVFFHFPCALLCTVFVSLRAAVVPWCRRAVKGPIEGKATDLFQGVRDGNRSAVALLLDNGASVNQADLDGYTALMVACQNGHRSWTQLLISRGAVVDQADNQGMTALMVACIRGHVSVIRFMLDSGANITCRASMG